MKEIKSHSPDETLQIAKEYAKGVKPGEVICLRGELGAGKTHFVKGFVQAFGILEKEVSSPTFTIIHEYAGSIPVYHFDCYRLEHTKDALEIGAEEYFYGSGVCIVEWPDRISEILPSQAKTITIETITKQERNIIFHNRYVK